MDERREGGRGKGEREIERERERDRQTLRLSYNTVQLLSIETDNTLLFTERKTACIAASCDRDIICDNFHVFGSLALSLSLNRTHLYLLITLIPLGLS